MKRKTKRPEPTIINPNRIYDTTELSETLGVSRRQITLMVQDGKLPDDMIGNKYRWTGESILRSLSWRS